MAIRRYTRGFQLIGPLVVVWLLVIQQQQASFLGGVGRFLALLILAPLLMFVVIRSADVCKAVAVRYQSTHILLPAIVTKEEQVWRPVANDFNPAEPALPSRFQLPPPRIAA